MKTSTILATAIALVALTPAVASAATARPVSLSDARDAPSVQHVLKPKERFSLPLTCAYALSDTSAYTARGFALGAQQWSADRTESWWQRGHGRVTFDGVEFVNRTAAPVIVAAWC